MSSEYIQNDIIDNQAEFYKIIPERMEEAIAVVDENLQIIYHNHSFVQLFGKQNNPLIGKIFGVSIGCRKPDRKKSLEEEAVCANCKLRLALLNTIRNQKDQAADTIVLELEHQEKTQLKLLKFQSRHLPYQNHSFAMVILSDMTAMGKDALKYVNSFYEDKE